jgi:glycosyltransferase involved in cell wall biosynthesis
MNVLRSIDAARYAMDFLVLYHRAGAFAPEAQSLGCQVFTSPQPRKVWRLWRKFDAIVRARGSYDIVHSHVHHFSGIVMRMAARHGVPIRIVHSHNDTRSVEREAFWHHRFYLRLMKGWIERFATHRIAVSRSAAEDLFGPDWSSDSRCRIIPCGVNLAAFAGSDCRWTVRRALGLAEDALVIGHVGRFHERKNHRLVLEIAAQVLARDPHARLLLIGDGELKPVIEARAAELHIADRVVLTGARADVPALMRAMDVFVFPSRYEGLGLAVVEAQAAGLPCVIASTMPEEIDVVPALIHRLPLSAPPELWAGRIQQAAAAPRPSPEEALRGVRASAFEIDRSVARLLDIYDMNQEFRLHKAGPEGACVS